MGFVAETGSGHVLNMDGAPRRRRPQPGAQTDGNRAGRHRRLHRLRRGADTEARAPRCARLPGEAELRTRHRGPEGLHAHPHALRVSGRGVPAAAVERAIALSHERYCSATIMLGKTAAVTTSFELAGGLSSQPDATAVSRRQLFRRGGPCPSSSAPRRASASAPAAATRRRRRPGHGRRGGPRRPSSPHTRARERASSAGRRSRWPARCCSTWRSVSTTKPRLVASPSRPANTPMPKAPAYQSGLSRLGA